MADAVLTLGFSTTAALSQLDRELATFERGRKLALNFDSSSIVRGTNSLDVLDKSISRTQSHLVAFAASSLIIGGLAKSIETAVTASVKFEAELAKVNLSLNASSSQLKAFGANLFDIARQTGTSFDEVTKAASAFATQGLSIAETLKRTKDALTLTRISGEDLNDSIETITSTIKEFNKESLSSTDVINRLASVQGKYAISTQELSEALRKVSPVANQVGLDLNHTIGIITAVTATTQQSADKIGTALTTILSATQKPTTIEALRNVGVQVEKIPGQYLPALDILKNLSAQYDNLSQAQQKQVTTALGGTRQLGILLATLGDVNKTYGLVAQATNTAANASDNAAKKNAELNKTLQSQANTALQTIEQVAAKAGSLTFTPILEKLFGGIQGGANIINGTDIGKKIGEGILSGIGQALSGPGLVVGAAVITKLVGKVVGSASGSLTELLNVNGSIAAQKDLQLAINSALKAQGLTYQDLLALDKARINSADVLLNIIKQQSAAQIGSEALSNNFASILASKGVSASYSGRINLATGYSPEILGATQNEQAAISQGIGNAYGAKPVVVPNFSIGGVRQTVVANSREFLVPTRSIDPGYSGPDHTSIINPQMISEMGGLPSGARPIFSKGYAPNFADSSSDLYQQIYGQAPQSGPAFQSVSPDDATGLIAGLGLAGAGGIIGLILSDLLSKKSGDITDVSKGNFGGSDFYSKQVLDDLLGEKATKRRTKKGLVDLGGSFGLDKKYLNTLTKPQIANRLNIEVLKDNPAAFKNLIGKGLRFDDDLKETVSNNFGILRGLGKFSDGYIPNFAVGDLIGEGYQSQVFDAGSNVFKQARPGRYQHQTGRGLQFLQALIGQDEGLQAMGLQAHAPIPQGNIPRALRGVFGGDKGFFQQKLSGLANATPEKAREIESAVNQAIQRRAANSRKGFTSFKLGDFNTGNILSDSEGNHHVIDLLTNKTESYRKILRSKNNYAGGTLSVQPLIGKYGYGIYEETGRAENFKPKLIKSFPSVLDNLPVSTTDFQESRDATGQRVLKPINSNNVTPDQRLNFLRQAASSVHAQIKGVSSEETFIQRIQEAERNSAKFELFQMQSSSPSPTQGPRPTDSISEVVQTPASSTKEDLIAQGRALGIKGLSPRMREETIRAKIAQASGAGSGGLPPNIPIAPPAPSAPTPPTPPRRTPSVTQNITPTPINSNLDPGLVQEAKFGALPIDITGIKTNEELRHVIIQTNKLLGGTPSSYVTNFGQSISPTNNGITGQGTAVGQLFNLSNVNLLNSNNKQGLPLNGPALRRNIRSEFDRQNQVLGNPLDSAQIGKLVEDQITNNAANIVKETNKQILGAATNRNNLKQTLAGLAIQSNATSISSQVQQAIATATPLTSTQSLQYGKSVRDQAAQKIPAKFRKDVDVVGTLDLIESQAVKNVEGQIETGQRNIKRNTAQTDFINNFGSQFGGNPFSNLSGSKANKVIEDFVQNHVSLGGDEGEARTLANSLRQQERQNQIQRRSNVGLGAAFGLPILIGAGLGAAGNSISPRVGNAITGVGTSIATGAAIASLAPTNRAVLGGGLLAATAGIGFSIVDSLGNNPAETSRRADNFQTQATNRSQSLNEYLQAQDHLKEVINQGGNSQQVGLAQRLASLAFNKIPDTNLKSQLIGKNTDDQRSIAFQSSTNDTQKQSSLDFDNSVAQINKQGGILGVGSASNFLGASELLGGSFSNSPLRFLTNQDRFAGAAGQDTLQNTINQLVQSGKGENGLKQLIFDAGLNKKEAQEATDLYNSLTKVTDGFKGTSEATDKAEQDLADFNKKFSLALSGAAFRTGFNAQGTFNQNQNSIEGQLNTLNNRADFTNPLAFIQANSQLQNNSIQNQAGLSTGDALKDTIDGINKAFSSRGATSSDDSNIAAKQVIDSIKNGSLSGNGALTALQQIIDATKGTSDSNVDLKDQLSQVKQTLKEKLDTIDQDTKEQTAKNDINTQKLTEALRINDLKNFGGGINSFLNPSSFNTNFNVPSIDNANAQSTLFQQNRTNSILGISANNNGGGTRNQNNFLINQNNQLANAGRSAFADIKANQDLFGLDYTTSDQQAQQKIAEQGAVAQARNNFVGRSDSAFGLLTQANQNSVTSQRLGVIQNNFNNAILKGDNLGAGQAFNGLLAVGAGATDPISKQQFSSTEGILSQLINELPKISGRITAQTDIALGNQKSPDVKGIPAIPNLSVQAQTISLSVTNIDALAKQLADIIKIQEGKDKVITVDQKLNTSGNLAIKLSGFGLDTTDLDQKIQQAVLDAIQKSVKQSAQIPQPPTNNTPSPKSAVPASF